ncbi:hypothetical protein VPH35_088679 [Triticum aestivum]
MPTNAAISHLIPLCLGHLSACIKHPDAMISALTLVSFYAKWGKSQQCSPKPIRSIPGPKATSCGLNKAFHGDGLYSSLNDKDIARLMELIDPDCTVEHTSYYKPLNFKVILSSAPISLQHHQVAEEVNRASITNKLQKFSKSTAQPALAYCTAGLVRHVTIDGRQIATCAPAIFKEKAMNCTKEALNRKLCKTLSNITANTWLEELQ